MIPYINTTNPSIPNVGIGGIRNVNVYMANVRDLNISDTRVWMNEPPSSVPPDVPVVVNIGKPIVDMPGCVTVHKENVKNRSKNRCWSMMTLKVIPPYVILVCHHSNQLTINHKDLHGLL